MTLKTCISLQLFVAAWAATVPTPTVPGIFNFTSLMDMVVSVSSPTTSSFNMAPGPICQLREIAECFDSTAPRFYSAVINIYRRETRTSICGIADDFDSCAAPFKPTCTSSDTLSFDIFAGLIQYLCTEQGYNDYVSFVPCISNTAVVSEINNCADSFPSPLSYQDLCALPDNYTSCVVQAVRDNCDGTSAKMLRQTLKTILYPLKIATCQNRSSVKDNSESTVVVSDFPSNVTTVFETTPTISEEPKSALEIASTPSTPDVTSTIEFSEDFSTTAQDFITREVSSSSLLSVLPVSQTPVLEISTLLPDIHMITQDVSKLVTAFVSPHASVDESSALLTDFLMSQRFSQDLTTVADLITSQMHQEGSSSTFQTQQEESVTTAPQILEEESVTKATQMLQEESVTTATQVLQEESVTLASQVLQEESVTTVTQILQEESVTTATHMMQKESVTLGSQILQEESVTTATQILQEESVTTATQMLQEESVTLGSQILQEESVTTATQILQEESVTTATQILQEESVTTATQILQEESVTTATQILQEESVTTATQILQEESVTTATQMLQEESVTKASQVLQEESVTIASQVLQEESVTIASQVLQEESVTIASQVLQEESVTTATQILQEESVTTATQILQEESVTIGSQVLQEESVTIGSQIPSEEFSMITPDATTPLINEFSTTEPDIKSRDEDSSRFVLGASESQIVSGDSSKVAVDIHASSLEISASLPFMTPNLSLKDVAITTLDTSTLIKSTEVVTTDVTEVLTEGFLIQPTLVVKGQTSSGEQELSTRTADQEQRQVLSTIVTDAATTTLSSQGQLTVELDDSIIATSFLDATVDAAATASREFPTAALYAADTIATSQAFSHTTPDIATSIVPTEGLLTATADVVSPKSLGRPSTVLLEATEVQTLLEELSTSSLEVSADQTSRVPAEMVPPESVRIVSTISLEGVSIETSPGESSATPLTVTAVQGSQGEFSTLPFEITTVQTSLAELSTPSFEITTAQESQGELSTATLEVTLSELFSENLVTELPHVSTSQEPSEGSSAFPSQISTAQTLSEELSATAADLVASSLATEDLTLPAIVPHVTDIHSSLDAFSTAVPNNGAFEVSTKGLSTSASEITVSDTSSEQFPTVSLVIETSQMSIGEFPTQTTDTAVIESSVGRFITAMPDIGTPEDSLGEFLTISVAETVTRVSAEQFSTAAPGIGTPTISLPEEFSSTVVSDITFQRSSSVTLDVSVTLISSEIFPTTSPDVTVAEASATATPSILLDLSTSITEIPTLGLVPTTSKAETPTINLDVSATAFEINTSGSDGTTISTTGLSTIGQEVSTDLAIEVPTITQEYTSSAEGRSTIVLDGTTIHPRFENLATTVIQDTLTDQTILVEGFTTSVRDTAVSTTPLEASSTPTHGFQILPSSVEFSSTATVDATSTQTSSQEITTTPPVTTTQTSSQETTTTASTTTTVPPTTTSLSPTTPRDFQTAPLNCNECHSGAPGMWQNVNCPANGRIMSWANLPSICKGPCVSVVTKYPAGEVYRACSTNYYFPTAPPREGCIKHNQDLFCFCSTDYCNTRDMVKEQQEYTGGANDNTI